MDQAVLTYLHDHLAGATFAIELLEEIRDQQSSPAAASLAARLIEEIIKDKASLEQLIEWFGGEPSSAKNIVSRIAEKFRKPKLNLDSPLGMFEAFEFLCLGVLGKAALWDALKASAANAMSEDEIDRLRTRASEQHAEVEAFRLDLARKLFQKWDDGIECGNHEQALRKWAHDHGVEMSHTRFSEGKAGGFDGVTLKMNSTYSLRERLFYAVHALGSIAIWTSEPIATQRMFDELREAKRHKPNEPERLASAVKLYRQFEVESSEHAVWILHEVGADSEVPGFTNLMRADLEAMTQFHEAGSAPVWNEFLARWNQEVSSGERTVKPFGLRPPRRFEGAKIETQEILQRQ